MPPVWNRAEPLERDFEGLKQPLSSAASCRLDIDN